MELVEKRDTSGCYVILKKELTRPSWSFPKTEESPSANSLCYPKRDHRPKEKTKDKVRPRKIQSILLEKYTEEDIPSATTIYNILRKEGLVITRRIKRRVPSMSQPFEPVNKPNDVWTADFKGQFLTKDGKWCYPLTVMDCKSRYLLQCRAFDKISTDDVKQEFAQLFRRYGLPIRIRTDNGVPFASRSLGGISHLSK